MGHRLQVNVPVDQAMTLNTGSAAERQKGSLSKYERVLIGIGIIFGTSGFFFWRLGIRSRRKVSRGFGEKLHAPSVRI